MSSVDCRGLLRSIFSQTQQCPGSPPGMSGDFAHINYKSHGWDIQELCYSRIYPRDGNPSSKNLGFVFSNGLYRKESEFMTGSVVNTVVNKYHLIVRGLFSNFKAPNIINKLLASYVNYIGCFKIRK